jgi:hypothetical protein
VEDIQACRVAANHECYMVIVLDPTSFLGGAALTFRVAEDDNTQETNVYICKASLEAAYIHFL